MAEQSAVEHAPNRRRNRALARLRLRPTRQLRRGTNTSLILRSIAYRCEGWNESMPGVHPSRRPRKSAASSGGGPLGIFVKLETFTPDPVMHKPFNNSDPWIAAAL